MPYWSEYLARLGEQVRNAANTTIWSETPADASGGQQGAPSGAGIAPHHRVRNPAGDRRMTAEQRRELLGVPGKAVGVSADSQALPFWSAYLSRLGNSLPQSDKQSPGVQEAQAKAAGAGQAPRYGVRRPIGDRRTGPRQRRSQPMQQGAVRWFFPRLWGRLTTRMRTVAGAAEQSGRSPATLGMWGYYFVAKLGLLLVDLMTFHALENLLFAAFILLPASSRILRRAKHITAAVIALSLLYYDSWLPPVDRALSQASMLSNFSAGYLFELSMRFISIPVAVALIAAWLVYGWLSRRVRLGAIVMAGMLGLLIVQLLPEDSAAGKLRPDMDMDKVVQDFFVKEAQRSVLFVTPAADAIPFDVVFLHVCSLSWDDVRAVGLDAHPLWQRFDILLTKFNSAASYSGPAALHLLRAKCGQPQHGAMYRSADEKCYLMNSLQRSGFEPNMALNHNGKFDDFLGQLKKHGLLTTPPLELAGLEVAQYAFDKSPVYDDLSVLSRWLDVRQSSGTARVALYYNTVSMHDGNHMQGQDSTANTLDAYKARLSKFLDETESFLQKLEASGRHAVVVMVPEHGAAVRGDNRQIAGLREIPTPSITLVPVGIAVVGGHRDGEPLLIDQPTSYLAISHIVEHMLEQSPYDNFVPSDYVADLPLTPFVAQNETTTVAEYQGQYYLGRGATRWEAYAEFNKSSAQR